MAKKSKLPVEMPCTASYKISKGDVERERRYRAEDGLRAIQRADEVRKDKGLVKDIKALVKEQAKTASKI
jgi:hypothetical protein